MGIKKEVLEASIVYMGFKKEVLEERVLVETAMYVWGRFKKNKKNSYRHLGQ